MIGRMRGYRYETRAVIASAVLIHEPAGIRKLTAYCKIGELRTFIWKRFETMKAARQVRRVTKQINVRWTEARA